MSKGRIPSQKMAVRVLIGGLILTIAAALALVFAALLGDDEIVRLPQAQQILKQTTVTPPTPSPTETMTEEETAAAAAMEVPQRYNQVVANVMADSALAPERVAALDSVADGPTLKEVQANARNAPYTQSSQDGEIAVVTVQVIDVDLANSRGIQPDGPSVVLHVCTDPTTAKYQRGGAPWDPPAGLASSQWDIRNYGYPNPETWKVWDIKASDESCE